MTGNTLDIKTMHRVLFTFSSVSRQEHCPRLSLLSSTLILRMYRLAFPSWQIFVRSQGRSLYLMPLVAQLGRTEGNFSYHFPLIRRSNFWSLAKSSLGGEKLRIPLVLSKACSHSGLIRATSSHSILSRALFISPENRAYCPRDFTSLLRSLSPIRLKRGF